jgi:hypothetical protein
MKRTPLHLATMLAVLLTGSAAFADFEQDIVRQLQDMGFSQVEVTRTLLGRVRITAAGADGTREIILNPNTGEILRDLWLRQEGGSSDRTLLDGGEGRQDRSSGSGSSGGDDDDDDDDDSSDSNSGGSGNSGSSGNSESNSGSNSGSGSSGKSGGGSDGDSGKGGDDDDDD